MENGNTLHDCKVNVNDVIQLIVKSKDYAEKESSIESDDKIEAQEEKEELVDAESCFYKVDDAIDCVDQTHGAWFEATIVRISRRVEELIYTVKWDFIEYAEPFTVSERFIRPRAWKVLKATQLKKGKRVMINHNLDKRQQLGYWYDFEISNIFINGATTTLTGTLYIGR